jgi:two-component system, OmpR family, phosphate regulon sensor histidine kinase PhoR
VIWKRWRERAAALAGSGGRQAPRAEDPFQDLLEEAPVMALLLDGERQVVAANRAARDFFSIDASRLPGGLLEVTREGRLLEALRAGSPEAELRLSHHKKIAEARLVPGPLPGDTLVFLVDVTEVRRLETVRREFVANLSHELRTPLTSLRLAAESLLGDPPAPTRQRFEQRVVKEADHLAGIVANLRQLVEIEGGVMAVQTSRFELNELIAETVERLGLDRPLHVRTPEHLQVTTDRIKLAQALGNLLDNAARFSPPGSPIEIEAIQDRAELRLTVRDHGPGISPEHWGRVFERFYKVDPARSRATTGSGLGLAITKHLVMALGGRVWTEAAPEGGQVFGIALPSD